MDFSGVLIFISQVLWLNFTFTHHSSLARLYTELKEFYKLPEIKIYTDKKNKNEI